jgi:carboxylesterase
MPTPSDTQIVPGAEPFYFPGDQTGCLLIHGFTAMPAEMCLLGEHLQQQGRTVLGVRLAGHATQPMDLAHTIWTDWLATVEDGLSVLSGTVKRVFLIGQSMGGMIALLSSARYPVAGVVAMSTPFDIQLNRLPPGKMIYKFGRKAETAFQGRRELNYPAYPSYPTSILLELKNLGDAMAAELKNIRVPVLLMHSDSDKTVDHQSMQKIYDQLTVSDKQAVLLKGMEHSVVRDPQRSVVFEAIDQFLQTHSADE